MTKQSFYFHATHKFCFLLSFAILFHINVLSKEAVTQQWSIPLYFQKLAGTVLLFSHRQIRISDFWIKQQKRGYRCGITLPIQSDQKLLLAADTALLEPTQRDQGPSKDVLSTPLYFSNGTTMTSEFASMFYENYELLKTWEAVRNNLNLMNLVQWAEAVNTTVDYLRSLIAHVHKFQPIFRQESTHTLEMPQHSQQSLLAATQRFAQLENTIFALEAQLQRPPTVEEWGKTVHLSSVEELRDVLKDGHHALTELVSLSSPLVKRLAQKYYRSFAHFHEEELLVAGLHAVQKGFKKMVLKDLDKKIPIAASTWVWAKSGILLFIYKNKSEIRIPSAWWDLRNQGKVIEKSLQTTLNRSPTNEEVAQKLGIAAARWEKILYFTKLPVSTETVLKGHKANEDSQDTVGDLLASSEDSDMLQQHALKVSLKDELATLLEGCLNDREKQLITTQFGFFDGRLKSIEETALALNLTVSNASNLLKQASSKLRNYETQRTLSKLSLNEKKALKQKGHDEVKQYVLKNSLMQQLITEFVSSLPTLQVF